MLLFWHSEDNEGLCLLKLDVFNKYIMFTTLLPSICMKSLTLKAENNIPI